MRMWRVALFLPAILIVMAAAGSSAAKTNPDTSLDRSFGHRGVVHSTFGGFPLALRALAVQSDGKIVVGGSWSASETDLASNLLVARYLPNGALDPSFGTRGWVTTSTGSHQSADLSGLALEPDGKIIAVGGSGPDSGPGTPRAEVVRYDANGSLDRSFGSGGMAKAPVGTLLAARAVAVQPDRKILVVGVGKGMVLARYLRDGSLDRSFGKDGVVIKRTRHLRWDPSGIAVAPDRDIVLIGNGVRSNIYGDTSHGIMLVRYHPDGSPDRHFGKRGMTTTAQVLGVGVALTKTGKIVVGGSANGTVDMPVEGFAAERYTAKGRLDRSFGRAGRAYVHVSRFPSNQVTGFARQPDGKIVLGGGVTKPHGYGTQVTLVRFRSNGRLDRGFGKNGVIWTRVGRTAASSALGLQRDGKILAAGGSWGTRGWSAILLRYLKGR